MPVSLTVDTRTQRFESKTIRIGTATENEFTFPNDSGLAPLHAVLRSVNGRWIVESRGGVDIRVGTGRPVGFAWLNSGDVIHLTESGPDLLFELPQPGTSNVIAQALKQREVQIVPQAIDPVPQTAQKQRGSERRDIPAREPQLQTIWFISGGIALLLVGMTAWCLVPRSKPQTLVAAPAPTVVSHPIPVPVPEVSKTPIDPREFLVLVGIGNLSTDNRPHVLGVG